MYLNILTKTQQELMPLLSSFKREYYLVGGTAIALQIGHRESIDFDLFKYGKINRTKIKQKIAENKVKIDRVVYEDEGQMHLSIRGVKFTFFQYPFEIPHNTKWDKTLTMPNLLDLAAMKAYALGGRAKWKDYVDLYFLLKLHFSYFQIAQRAKELFKEFFTEKLFREQLSYFNDVNYEEEVVYCGENISEDVIKDFLIDKATEAF